MTTRLQIDPAAIEEAAKLLYIRALKLLPDDIKQGFTRLDAGETDGTAKAVLATMIQNIAVAEARDNLLCQDTGIPIYNVTIGRAVEVDDRHTGNHRPIVWTHRLTDRTAGERVEPGAAGCRRRCGDGRGHRRRCRYRRRHDLGHGDAGAPELDDGGEQGGGKRHHHQPAGEPR